MSATAQHPSAEHGLAVYAGTFDPITNGHVDVIERALTVFQEVRIGVAESTSKNVLFETEQRVELVKQAVSSYKERVKVEPFDGLLVDYVRRVGAHVIVRGLRAVSDYEYESQMAMINRKLAEDIETVFLMTSDHCSFISSSVVKDIAKNRGDVSGLVPSGVASRLKRLYS